jgi:hypothetical protein
MPHPLERRYGIGSFGTSTGGDSGGTGGSGGNGVMPGEPKGGGGGGGRGGGGGGDSEGGSTSGGKSTVGGGGRDGARGGATRGAGAVGAVGGEARAACEPAGDSPGLVGVLEDRTAAGTFGTAAVREARRARAVALLAAARRGGRTLAPLLAARPAGLDRRLESSSPARITFCSPVRAPATPSSGDPTAPPITIGTSSTPPTATRADMSPNVGLMVDICAADRDHMQYRHCVDGP